MFTATRFVRSAWLAVVASGNVGLSAVIGQAQLHAEGSAPLGGAAAKAAEYLRREQTAWATLIRAARIKLES